jgi:hypothetical protein
VTIFSHHSQYTCYLPHSFNIAVHQASHTVFTPCSTTSFLISCHYWWILGCPCYLVPTCCPSISLVHIDISGNHQTVLTQDYPLLQVIVSALGNSFRRGKKEDKKDLLHVCSGACLQS